MSITPASYRPLPSLDQLPPLPKKFDSVDKETEFCIERRGEAAGILQARLDQFTARSTQLESEILAITRPGADKTVRPGGAQVKPPKPMSQEQKKLLVEKMIALQMLIADFKGEKNTIAAEATTPAKGALPGSSSNLNRI